MSGKFEKINCTKTNWGIIDFTLMKNIGSPIASILLTEYISFYNSIRNKPDFDGELYRSRKTITDKMGLSVQEQRTAEGHLKDLNLIEITVKGIPATNHIKLNWNQINEYQRQDCVNQQSCPDKNDSLCDNNNLDDLNENQGSLEKKNDLVLAPTDCDVTDNNLYSIRKKEESFNKLKEKDLEKPNQSRLIKKETPILVKKETVRPSLLNETKKINHNVKPLSLTERNKLCIEYWNSKPELQSHQINETDPSKTIKTCISLLNAFFNGKILDKAILPDKFDSKLWNINQPSMDDFKYFVDEICYCITEPALLPKKNGHKMSMIDFLCGCDRLNVSGGLLTYCIGDYKTVIENKFPKTCEKIKDIWNKEIGKFELIAENEKSFVIISNLCHDIYAERKAKDKDWLPSMNEYSPVGIFRNILAGNMWIKEKKRTPEYLNTKFFTGMVRRYNYDRTTGEKTW